MREKNQWTYFKENRKNSRKLKKKNRAYLYEHMFLQVWQHSNPWAQELSLVQEQSLQPHFKKKTRQMEALDGNIEKPLMVATERDFQFTWRDHNPQIEEKL